MAKKEVNYYVESEDGLVRLSWHDLTKVIDVPIPRDNAKKSAFLSKLIDDYVSTISLDDAIGYNLVVEIPSARPAIKIKWRIPPYERDNPFLWPMDD